MYKAIVTVAYGQGGCGEGKFWSATRSAFSKSPKRAIKQAKRLANCACGEGAAWIPVMECVSLMDAVTGKIIHREF